MAQELRICLGNSPPKTTLNPGFMIRKVLSIASVGLFALAGSAGAQIANTGTGGGAFDSFWKVSHECLPGFGSLCPTDDAPVAASIIAEPPSPPWAPNDDVSAWIGATSTGNWPGGGPGDNTPRLRYYFQTDLLGGHTVNGLLGWDNQLVGYEIRYVGGSSWTGFVAASSSWLTPFDDGRSGFCRDDDGVFPGSNYPGNCLATIDLDIGPTLAKVAEIRFIVDGDGVTDGFRFAGTAPGTVVPEPSTYILMATGLLGLGIAARRRRS